MSGMGFIEGGWEFIWTAYAVTAVVLLGYAGTLVLRYRAERARADREARRGPEVAS
jgi:heme exporter protein CcmD